MRGGLRCGCGGLILQKKQDSPLRKERKKERKKEQEYESVNADKLRCFFCGPFNAG